MSFLCSVSVEFPFLWTKKLKFIRWLSEPPMIRLITRHGSQFPIPPLLFPSLAHHTHSVVRKLHFPIGGFPPAVFCRYTRTFLTPVAHLSSAQWLFPWPPNIKFLSEAWGFTAVHWLSFWLPSCQHPTSDRLVCAPDILFLIQLPANPSWEAEKIVKEHWAHVRIW